MFKKHQPDHVQTDASDYAKIFLFGIIPTIMLLILILRYLYTYMKSSEYKERTMTPSYPPWLSGNLSTPQLRNTVFPHPGFSVYTKDYTRKTRDHRRSITEKDKKVLQKLRKLIGNLYELTVDWELLPDTTCIISLPKWNFKCGIVPGTFTPLREETVEHHYEYQMIGDYRIQVAYFVVKGISYVAGISIYLEDPYQESLLYNARIIRKLLTENDYLITSNLMEETVHIVLRRAYKKNMIVTRNKYGEELQWTYNDQIKKFEPFGPIGPTTYEMIPEENPRIQSRNMRVKMCEQEMVMITERKGKKVHVKWNKDTKEMDLFSCENCNQSDDPPPSYLLVNPE